MNFKPKQMKHFFYVCILSILLAGCATENQQKALDEIAKNYEAKTGFVKGFSNKAGESTIVYFRINISDSEVIENLNPEHTASNIAIIAVKNMTPEDLKKYTHIEVEIKNRAGDIITRNFEIGTLLMPVAQFNLFERFSNSMLQSNFTEATALVDSQYQNETDSETIEAYMSPFIEENGNIVKYISTEFNYRIYEESDRTFLYKGKFVFPNGKTLGYQVETYENPSQPYIYSFKID